MFLRDYFTKYESNMTLQLFLKTLEEKSNIYANITETPDGYEVESTSFFNTALHATKCNITLNKSLEINGTNCGCLQFHKNNECVHMAALYAVTIFLLDYEKYHNEQLAYKRSKLMNHHNLILNRISSELKVANPYVGLIHLIPVIEVNGTEYSLSLKIGLDKDYVIKDILEFINNVENNISYCYGQKLDFVHSYECFNPASKEFYSFVRNISNETTIKSIPIRKSHLLTILEIFKNETIFFKALNDPKAFPRQIVAHQDDIYLHLNSDALSIQGPQGTSLLMCGVNNAYFLDFDKIYAYSYKNRIESKVFECLYRVDGNLLIDANTKGFISELLPLIRTSIDISDDFYNKYPIPIIKINSYLTYNGDSIVLSPKIGCKEVDRESPYLRQLLEGYQKQVEVYGFIKGKDKKYSISGLDLQYKFLTSDLSTIKAFGEVFFDENMKSIKTKKSAKTRVNISYNVGLLDFSFENPTMTVEEIQAMLLAYNEKKKFIKLKDNTIIEIDEDTVKEISDFLEDFNISIKEMSKPINKPLNYILKLVSGEDTNVLMDNEVVKTIQTLQNFKKADVKPTEMFSGVLREYQLDAFKWLKTLAKFNFGGILADDMGLGKTLEIISFLEEDKKQKPSLIVCPMSLVYNWENECEKWNLSSKVVLVLGSSEERKQIINDINPDEKALYITSYDSLRRDVELYNTEFRFVIADEAQYIKNQFAQKSEAIKSLRSEINYALTGTPIENGLSDLWSIFDFLMPGYLSSYGRFKSRYESLIAHDDYEALDTLKKRVAPFILRRTKKDVLKDLPDKIEDFYYCKMDNKQKEVYESYVGMLKEDLNNGGNNVLALLTRLRQICITPELIYQEPFENTKINMAVDIIRSSIEGNHRILLFSQFSQSFPIISKLLDRMNIKHFILDGTTKAKNRIEMVEEFNKNDEIKVFLISLKAGGTGLNLVGADTVIHLDPWWNSSAESQATDRAYRMGQTKDVTVIKLLCKDTIEEKVVELQKIKKDLAESIVMEDGKKPFKLTKQDILNLLE